MNGTNELRPEPTRGTFIAMLGTVLLCAASASANPEPSTYDTRSLSMGFTGTTYLERPAALVLNPANLEGIDKFGFALSFTNIFVRSFAPVQGPNTKVRSPLAHGPLPSFFVAGRIAPRVVFGAGVYIEAGFAGNYPDTICIDGEVVGPAPDYVADTNPETCFNRTAQDLKITAFIGEAAVGTSIRVTDELWLGLAIRLPFSRQVADVWSNIGAAFEMLNYERVKSDLGGIGFPSPRFGLTWKPHPKLTFGAVYRMYSKIKLSGETSSALLTQLSGDAEVSTRSEWNIPHMFQLGFSSQVNSRLLVVVEYRMQFHAAAHSGNLNQPSVLHSSTAALNVATTAPLGWKTVWSIRPAVEYRFRNPLLAWRGGLNLTAAATNPQWANFRSSPWGLGVTGTTGMGFYWDGARAKDQFRFDLGFVFDARRSSNGNEYIDQEAKVPGSSETEIVCSGAQAVRTGCPGGWGTTSFLASLGFTLQY
ncbi:MAG: outer membrane protein transport protein [Polyangiales bacterium]